MLVFKDAKKRHSNNLKAEMSPAFMFFARQIKLPRLYAIVK